MRSRQSIVCRRTAHVIRFHRTQVSGLENVHESIRTIITLGTPGAEDVNREDLQVFDTVSGESCFNWRRNFPATYSRVSSAAISPSGEFVAIASENTLSIYRLPTVCQSATVR